MLKISGPSRITQETADFSKKNEGVYTISMLGDLIWFLNANHHSLTTMEETSDFHEKKINTDYHL